MAANGNGVYYGGVSAPVTQLTNVTFSNISGLTASDIPPLSYFPATSTIAIAYGGTGTSTVPSANKLLLSDTNGNWEYVATSSLGIMSGQWATLGTTVSYSGGGVVIGTTTANHEFDVWGTSNTPIGITTGDPTLTVTNAGQTLGNGSSVAFQGVDTNGSEITLARISDISTSLTAGALPAISRSSLEMPAPNNKTLPFLRTATSASAPQPLRLPSRSAEQCRSLTAAPLQLRNSEPSSQPTEPSPLTQAEAGP